MVLTGRVGLMPCQPIHKKDPDLAATILAGLDSEVEGCFAVANQFAERLVALGGSCQHGTLSSQAPRLTTSTTHTSRRTLRPSRLAARLQHSREGVGRTRELWRCLRVVLCQGSHSIVFPRMDSEIFRALFLRRLRLPFIAPQRTRLPMWPSPRQPWPSSVCVCCLRCSGPERAEQGSRPT